MVCLIVGLQSISTNIKYSHQTEKKWGETGNSVYSVLKRNREREERKKYLDIDYEPDWSEMRVVREEIL